MALADFTLVATHPYAINQPTTCVINGITRPSDGKTINALAANNGKIYTGYGDWSCNTGPITICGLDPVSETFNCEYTYNTEAIALFNVLDGDLFAPAKDPSGSDWGDAYAAKINGSWNKKTVTSLSGNSTDYPVHSEDFGLYQGDLYFATDHWDADAGTEGSGRQFGVIWKSTNNGASWTQALSYPQYGGNTGVPGTSASTFCFAASLNGKLYAQLANFDCSGKRLNYSDVFDGSTWTAGPSLIPTIGTTKKVRNFDDYLVMIHGSKLYVFDGVSTTLSSDAMIHDYTISGDELYVLRKTGQVCRTKNMVSYNCFDVLPTNIADGESIEALDNFVYVGTTLSQLYKAPIPERSGFLPPLYYLLFD